MSDEQRFYDKLELVALHLHGKGLVSTQDLELMDSRAVFGLLAVVLLQYAVREAASRSHRVVTMDEDQHDPTVPTIFDDVRDRFINVRDRVGNLRGLTAGEMEWLQARLIDPHAHSDPPSHFGRDRASGLSDVFKRVYGTAVEMSRLSAFSAYLELLAADFPMLAALRQGRWADAAAQLLQARALPIAARLGQLRVVHRIMHLRGDWGEWLLYAAYSGHPCEVALALRRGAGVDTRSACGATPLIMAAMGGHAEVARLLLAWGANPALATKRGLTVYGAFQLGSERGASEPHQRRRYAQVAALLTPLFCATWP